MVATSPRNTVVARSLGSELVLLDLPSGACFTANAPGALIWRLHDQGADLDEVVRAFLDAYDVDGDVARAEVQAFLDAARQAGLLD